MKKSRLLGAVCACVFLFVFTSSKAASIIGSSSLNVFDLGSDAFDNTNIAVQFYDPNPIVIDFHSLIPSFPDDFNIEIYNYTGVAWSDFHFTFNNAQILQPLAITNGDGVLVGADITPSTATLYFNPPESFGFFGAGVIASQVTYWSLEIAPSIVPIPPAVWLFGSGLLGLIGVARRKAA